MVSDHDRPWGRGRSEFAKRCCGFRCRGLEVLQSYFLDGLGRGLQGKL